MNSCCYQEESPKERETQELQLTSATAKDEINWNKRRHWISQGLIKQLHKQHYQLHITNQIDFISVRLLEKLLLRINRWLDTFVLFEITIKETSVSFCWALDPWHFDMNITLVALIVCSYKTHLA